MMQEGICLAQKRKKLLGRVKQELGGILHKAGSENMALESGQNLPANHPGSRVGCPTDLFILVIREAMNF